jgi:type VI secretion system protein
MSRMQMNFIALMVTGLFIVGCSGDSAIGGAVKSASTMTPAKVWIDRVKFNPTPDVNSNAPVSVHLVVAYDDEPLAKLSALTSQQYFEQEQQLRRDYPDKADFFSWEIAPGQPMDDAEVELTKVSGVGGVFFARYSTPGAHRLAIADERYVQLNLSKLDFTITKLR